MQPTLSLKAGARGLPRVTTESLAFRMFDAAVITAQQNRRWTLNDFIYATIAPWLPPSGLLWRVDDLDGHMIIFPELYFIVSRVLGYVGSPWTLTRCNDQVHK